MAYYDPLPSGKHSYVVRLPNGKRKRFTDPLKKAARTKAEDFEAALRRGGAIVDQRLTVEDWAAKWFQARRVEPNTAAKNASHWKNHIQPQWGRWPLASIDRLDVQAWVNGMDTAGVGATTIAAAYNLLSKMLGDAVLSKKLHANPCVEIELPKVAKPAPRWFTRDEYGRIQLTLAGRTLRRGKSEVADPLALQWQAYVGLGCYSGLRCPGELAGLDVRHVDFERQQVHVQQVLTRQGMKAYPKTESSNRWVPFPDEVGQLLWRLLADRPSGPAFLSPTGMRVNEANFRNRVWRPALEAAGVDYEDPYTMRHTAASWWAQAGLPDYRVAALLGHSSTRQVAVYAHLDPHRHDDVHAAWGRGAEVSAPPVPQPEKRKTPRPSGRGV